MLFEDGRAFRMTSRGQTDKSLGALKLNSLGIPGIWSNKLLSSPDYQPSAPKFR